MPSFTPEQWHLIPTFPRFGSLTDYRNGGAVGSSEEKRFDTLQETSVGLVDIHTGENEFNFLAVEMGVDLSYDRDGSLTDVGVDVLSFCDSCSEEDYEEMGEESLDEILGAMVEANEQMFISFDFNGRTVAVAKRNNNSGEKAIISAVEDVDFSLSTTFRVKYNEYYLFVGFKVVDDEFSFGLLATPAEESYTPQKTMIMMSILNDCNYQTFLNGSSPSKYDKLARRIFFRKPLDSVT